MPPKKKDAAAQKAARDKKILMVLGPVFIIIFVVMVLPKLTGGKGSPPPAVAAGTDTTSTVAGGTPVAATGTPATPAAAPVAGASAVSAPSYSFSANDGQLKRLSGDLKTKDPFAGAPDAATVKVGTTPVVQPSPPTQKPGSQAASGSGGKGVPALPAATPASAPTPYIYAVLSVNGLAEGVALHGPFSAAHPIFTLTAIGSSWVKFSLITGSFATGAKDLLLEKGKSVTLRNTADGSRYVVRLIAVSKTVPTSTTTGAGSTDPLATTPDNSGTATSTDGTSTTPPPPTTPGS
jgi:hypothetical protein